MKLRCAILDDYQQVAMRMADWESIAASVEVSSFSQHFDSESDLARALENFEILVVMRERTPITESLLKRLPKLRLIVTSGMRNSAIDIDSASARGVTICGTASSSEPPVELTWALILALAKNLLGETAAFANGGAWQSSICCDLRGRQLGLVGLGKIGSRMARIGTAFGMNVVAWSPHLTPERAADGGAAFAGSKEELLETSDFVSVHLVLSESTRDLIKAPDLRRMKKTAFLVNTSRAAIINQEALVEALQQGWIAGAGLDVFEIEPLPAGHIFRSLPNLVCTPHLGHVSQSNYATYFREAIEDIQAFLSGSPIRQLPIHV